jgi:1,4-dihydroxy-2-naphthoate octaprenyltransferase
MLILYVNEIPDRRGDAHAGKRTLPVRFSQVTIVTGYLVAAAAAFLTVVGGVVVGILPWPTLIALVAVPYAARVHRGLGIAYDRPYVLMGYMGTNIRLHLTVGGLLLVAYAVVLVVGAIAPSAPLYVPLGLGR